MDNNTKQQSAMKDSKNNVSKLVSLVGKNKKQNRPNK